MKLFPRSSKHEIESMIQQETELSMQGIKIVQVRRASMGIGWSSINRS